jgi:hypothetical protein
MRNCRIELKKYVINEDDPGAAVFSIIPRISEVYTKKEKEWFSTSDGSDDLT